MTQESFINYKRFRWLWLNLSLALALTITYFTDNPLGGRNGGTWFGFLTGIYCALVILYLMWFGVRKRSYASSSSTLYAWLSAHVWLGISLVYLVLLHSGFHIGLNVHTAAYLLMIGTVLSGIWGAINYRTIPYETKSNRGGSSLKALIQEFDECSEKIDSITRDRSSATKNLARTLDSAKILSAWSTLFNRKASEVDKKSAVTLLGAVPDPDREIAEKVIELIDRKFDIASQLAQDVRSLTFLRLWLFLHIPLSFGCVAAVIIHIISVYFYR